MDEIGSTLQSLNSQMQKATDNLDMASEIFENVVERTGNFREGFYSGKKIRELARGSQRALRASQLTAQTPEELVETFKNFIQDLENIYATVMTEIERLDK